MRDIDSSNTEVSVGLTSKDRIALVDQHWEMMDSSCMQIEFLDNQEKDNGMHQDAEQGIDLYTSVTHSYTAWDS